MVESTRKFFEEEVDKTECWVKRKEENMSFKVMIKHTNIDKFLKREQYKYQANIYK